MNQPKHDSQEYPRDHKPESPPLSHVATVMPPLDGVRWLGFVECLGNHQESVKPIHVEIATSICSLAVENVGVQAHVDDLCLEPGVATRHTVGDQEVDGGEGFIKQRYGEQVAAAGRSSEQCGIVVN